MKRYIATLFMVLAIAGAVASAATLTVPSPAYPTITAALEAASSGDTITVTSAYTGAGEIFPILVQKDFVTVEADGFVEVDGVDSRAVFVVGAYREYKEGSRSYEPVRVSGVTIRGFSITGGDIGVLVKEADLVSVIGNEISATDEGIRLLDAQYCTIEDNTIDGAAGVGIFLEASNNNTLEDNDVLNSGLGLFIFESEGNTVTGGEFNNNANGGVVLNDSNENTLSGLEINGNEGWGARFVFADDNKLLDSWIEGNTWGGVQLMGSVENLVEGNVVYNNGTANDDSDDAQIVITSGDKAIFTTEIFDAYNDLANLSEFVDRKSGIYVALDAIEPRLVDLNVRLWQVRQHLTTSGGVPDAEAVVNDLLENWLPKLEAELETIEAEIDALLAIVEGWYGLGLITEGDFEDLSLKLDEAKGLATRLRNLLSNRGILLPTGMPINKEATFQWEDEIPVTEFNNGASLQLPTDYTFGSATMDGRTFYFTVGDPLSFEVDLDALKVVLEAQDYQGWYDKDLADDMGPALISFGPETFDVVSDDNEGYKVHIDIEVTALYASFATQGYTDIKDQLELILNHINNWPAVDHFIDNIDTIKAKMRDEAAHMRYKLCRVDHELPPFPEVNSDLVGKKEKPFAAITPDEIDHLERSIVDQLNACPVALGIYNVVQTGSWTTNDIQVGQLADDAKGVPSTHNTISSNLITSDLVNTDNNIGIVIECRYNLILNNLITNERVEPIDASPAYGQFHRLDVAMILLADECLIAYNTIEWVDQGLIRGGTWRRKDLQTEYVFDKLARAAYWPGTNHDRFPLCCVHPHPGTPATCYTAESFDKRPVAWVPVLSVTSEPLAEHGFMESKRVERNRIALNFFEKCGTTIDNLDARSNDIDHNLFYRCQNGIVFRAPGEEHPWYAGVTIGGAQANIQLYGNDYYGGIAVDNRHGALMVGADSDYTPPQGKPGHALVSGNVNPPAAPSPHAFGNFLYPTVFGQLETWVEARTGLTVDLVRFQWEGLPPNLGHFGFPITLPGEKPRHPEAIFDVEEPPVELKATFTGQKWHLFSVPVVPADNSVENVFSSVDVPFLLVEYVDGAYVVPTEILPARGYWIYPFGTATVEFAGHVTIPSWEVELTTAGWHQVSTPRLPVPWEAVKFTDGTETKSLADALAVPWLVPTAYSFDSEADDYDQIDFTNAPGSLDPWTGYFIETRVDGITMILPDEYVPTVPTTALTVPLSRANVPAHMQPPAPPSLGALGAGLLTAVSYPNPVADGQATFRVTGLPVQQVRVTVYELGGRAVWQAENEGNQLSWNLLDSAGRAVANGVYLYFVEARVGGQWLSTKVSRLLIIR